MTKRELKKKVLSFNDWEFWFDRPLHAFILSMQREGCTRKYMRKAGLDVEWPAVLFQDGKYYSSKKVCQRFADQLASCSVNAATVFHVISLCEKFYKTNKIKIRKVINSDIDSIKKLTFLDELFAQIYPYIWIAHGFDFIYEEKLKAAIYKHYKGNDPDKFLGDISFPIKKNKYHYLVKSLTSSKDLKQIQSEFGWIKVRDGFSSGFSISELAKERERLKKERPQKFRRPQIPNKFKRLAKIAQELVYFRTLRTDILYEFMWVARPILKEVARLYKINFSDLRYYSLEDLINGTPVRYPKEMSYIQYGKHYAFFNKPIFKEKRVSKNELSGSIAYKGFVMGKAKIVKVAHQIGKVKDGDVLVAPTTFPSFILGMKRAGAFVTDEGGITSHAAIVSRELKKPCIIGTKIATKVFKDGDLVEVDAENGIVRKISKRKG